MIPFMHPPILSTTEKDWFEVYVFQRTLNTTQCNRSIHETWMIWIIKDFNLWQKKF